MFSLQIKYAGYPPEKRLWNEALRRVFTAVGREWHQEYYERHFTHAGAEEYGYYKRKGELLSPVSKAFKRSYTGRKLRQFGHTLPLRFTSATYQLGKVAVIKSTSKGGRVILPRGLNRKHAKTRIVMRDEITKVLPQEADHLRQIADRRLGVELAQLKQA